jgi:hypothetical protein
MARIKSTVHKYSLQVQYRRYKYLWKAHAADATTTDIFEQKNLYREICAVLSDPFGHQGLA